MTTPAKKAPAKATARAAVRKEDSTVKEVDSRGPEVDVPGMLTVDAEKVYNIQEAILGVMRDVGAVRKTQDHDAPGAHFKFRGVDQVVNAVQPAFLSYGVTITPKVLERVQKFSVPIGGQQKPQSWAEVTMAYTLEALDGSKRVWEAPGAAMDSGDKALGKACSVAYRIAMLQGLCIPTDEPDPDEYVAEPDSGDGYQTHGRGQNVRQEQPQPHDEPPPSEADKIRLYTLGKMREFERDGQWIRNKFHDLYKQDYVLVDDLNLLKQFGKTLVEEAIQDKALEEEQAVANVIGGLGATVVEEPTSDDT